MDIIDIQLPSLADCLREAARKIKGLFFPLASDDVSASPWQCGYHAAPWNVELSNGDRLIISATFKATPLSNVAPYPVAWNIVDKFVRYIDSYGIEIYTIPFDWLNGNVVVDLPGDDAQVKGLIAGYLTEIINYAIDMEQTAYKATSQC